MNFAFLVHLNARFLHAYLNLAIPRLVNASTLLFQGGGLYISDTAHVTMTLCNVYENTASVVSAITLPSSVPH